MPRIQAKVIKWSAPGQGVYKCNIDGSSKGETGSSSIGFCVRNWEGTFISAETRKIEDCHSLSAEVRAIRIALQHCLSNQYTPLVIETDSTTVEQVLQGTQQLTILFRNYQPMQRQF